VARVLVVNRFEVRDESAFTPRASAALAALAGRPGFVSGGFGRAVDDPERWCLVTRWESVGAYRRALSAFEVKVEATPLLAESLDEPSAYEVLLSAVPGGPVTTATSDRAPAPPVSQPPALPSQA
jgi:heme oxygenase (mycobilin-producing)